LEIGRHNVEIERNRLAWGRKAPLRLVYRSFHEKIAAEIDPAVGGPIVEIGSGIGAIKDVIPQCVTTDIFPNPWLDRVENAYALSFPDASVGHLILFDVWHHLRYPGTALREFRRVVAPAGRLILFEPAISLLSRLAFGCFHAEPIAMRRRIEWEAPAPFHPEQVDYYAAQGNATRHFWRGDAKPLLTGWTIVHVEPITSLRYLATGGFSGPMLARPRLFRILGAFERAAARWPRVFATRLLVTLKREGGSDDGSN
jgi:SAM-dependent methyltransferase